MNAKLKPKYQRLLSQYDNEQDMCNQLGLNYDEIYDFNETNGKSSDDAVTRNRKKF